MKFSKILRSHDSKIFITWFLVTWFFNWSVKWPRSSDQGEDPGGFVALLSLHVSMFYKTVFHFLEHFWNMNMVSRELNGFNLIGLQWLHHCLTISSSHFSLFILENFRKWWKSCQFRAKTCCFCDFYEKHEKSEHVV